MSVTHIDDTTALHSLSIANIMPAQVTAQAAFTAVRKTATNTHFGNDYATLADCLEAALPALNANGLALVQHLVIDTTGTVVLVSRVYHVSGEWFESRYPVLPTKGDPQGYGSAITYARRYAVLALLGLAPDDDDGNAASAPAPRNSSKSTPRQTSIRPSKPAPAPALSDTERAEIESSWNDMIAATSSVTELDQLTVTLKAQPEWLRTAMRKPWSARRDEIAKAELAQGAPDLDRVGGES